MSSGASTDAKVETAAESDPPELWFLETPEKTYGPLEWRDLLRWAEEGRVAPEHRVSRDRQHWVCAESLGELQQRRFPLGALRKR